ncbi:MAG: neutral zinc metallopeptidase, partial [Actinomycetia bacterium]|nr:neutral zinc metallopeptidase [Actinomycetes bacterium]
PIPWPSFKNQTEAEQLSRRNRLYRQTTAGPVSCPYDPIDFQRDGTTRSRQLLEATYACLMPIWASALSQAGYDLPRGPLYLVDQDFTTPCGRTRAGEVVKIDTTAGYYCSQNMAIYMNVKVPGRYLPHGVRTYSTEIVLAHELGHHIQARAGILNASWGIQYQLKGEPALVENRRRELQAQCFAGMALAAMAHSYGITPEEMAVLQERESRRSDATHGTPRSIGLWTRAGLEAGGQIGRCNTFAAAPSDVA